MSFGASSPQSRPSTFQSISSCGFALGSTFCQTASTPDFVHPSLCPEAMRQQAKDIVVHIQQWPTKPRSISNDFDFRQFRLACALQPLQELSRDGNPQPVGKKKAHQICAGPIPYSNHPRIMRLEQPGASDGGIHLPFRNQNTVRFLSHAFSPKAKPTR